MCHESWLIIPTKELLVLFFFITWNKLNKLVSNIIAEERCTFLQENSNLGSTWCLWAIFVWILLVQVQTFGCPFTRFIDQVYSLWHFMSLSLSFHVYCWWLAVGFKCVVNPFSFGRILSILLSCQRNFSSTRMRTHYSESLGRELNLKFSCSYVLVYFNLLHEFPYQYAFYAVLLKCLSGLENHEICVWHMLIYGIFFSKYQSIGFRVPPGLKSYCDANTAKG